MTLKLSLEIYKNAQTYANSVIKNQKKFNIKAYDFNRLEGLQYGIGVFDGLNIKEILLLEEHLGNILLKRGCSNNCVHCFCEAIPQPIVQEGSSYISSMSYEDFSDITLAFKALRHRLGLSTLSNQIAKPIVPFLDADSMEITLKDKFGVEHDMLEIAQNFNNNMGRMTLFDTSGWTPTFNVMQKRAEKYVKNFLEQVSSGNSNFIGYNVSLNPFHSLHAKSIELKSSNPEKSNKFRDLYTTRMANVFYTMSPLFRLREFRILNRAFPDEYSCNDGFKLLTHKNLISEIANKLKALYETNGLSNKEIKNNMDIFNARVSAIDTQKLGVIGRAKKLFDKNSEYVKQVELKEQENYRNPADMLKNRSGRFLIDCNGKVYLVDDISVAPTNIMLNIHAKDKQTPPLAGLIDKVVNVDNLL